MAAITFDAAHQAGASAALQFQPLDRSIVSEALPAFFIGRDKYGFWVARDPKKGGSVGFSCSSNPRCRSQDGTAGRRDTQRSFHPRRSNSTWRTTVIRLFRILDR
jgi:hypothetical protein